MFSPRGLIPIKLTITFYKNNYLEVPHHSLRAAHFLVCPCRKEPPYTYYRCMYMYIPLLTSLLFIFLLHGLVLGRYEEENILIFYLYKNVEIETISGETTFEVVDGMMVAKTNSRTEITLTDETLSEINSTVTAIRNKLIKSDRKNNLPFISPRLRENFSRLCFLRYFTIRPTPSSTAEIIASP